MAIAPLKTDEEKIDDIHRAVNALQVAWNGGPGVWPPCVVHAERLAADAEKLAKLTKRSDWIIRIMLLCIGGGMVLTFLVEHQQLLKLLAKP